LEKFKESQQTEYHIPMEVIKLRLEWE